MRSQEDARFLRALGTEVREIRRDRGLNQDRLAERAGMSRQMVSKIECGHRSGHNVVFLWRLTDALGVPLSVVVDCAVRELARRKAAARLGQRPDPRLAPRRR